MNYADSARIKAVLTHAGMIYVSDISEANLIIFDTCSVRQKSEDKVAGKMIEIRPDQKVRMTGCMIQHYLKNDKIKQAKTGKKSTQLTGNFVWGITTQEPEIIGRTNTFEDDLRKTKDFGNILYVNHAFSPLWSTYSQQYPNVELFFRIDDTGFLPLLADRLGYDVVIDNNLTNEYNSIIPHNSNQLFSDNTKTAYVPVSTGCSQFCSYCIVPYARGLENNRPVEDIVTEVKHHLKNGIEEIVLLGQIVNKHPQFVDICKQVLELPGLVWLRYTSPYPTFFPPELLDLHEHHPKMCPHIHMPLQSGSDHMLRKMFRGYSVSDYRTFIDNIRKLKRPISITTDIIVGHPDETDQDFQDSMELTRYAGFDMIYIGIYSPRPGTIWAKKYEDNVPMKIKKQRRNELNDLLKTISESNNQKEIGTTKQVMISRKLKNGDYFGYTDNMKNIVINTPVGADTIRPKTWSFAQVQITWAEAFKLFGEVI